MMDKRGAPDSVEAKASRLQRLVADPAFALVVAAALALLIASLSSTVGVNLRVGAAFLCATWLVGMLLIFLVPAWRLSGRGQIMYGLAFGGTLFLIGQYERDN